MNKKGVMIPLLLLVCCGIIEASVTTGQFEKNDSGYKPGGEQNVIREFDEADFFGDYQASEVIKRVTPQPRSALSIFIMQSGIWVLMKVDTLYKQYVSFKRWLIRWAYGKRKA